MSLTSTFVQSLHLRDCLLLARPRVMFSAVMSYRSQPCSWWPLQRGPVRTRTDTRCCDIHRGPEHCMHHCRHQPTEAMYWSTGRAFVRSCPPVRHHRAGAVSAAIMFRWVLLVCATLKKGAVAWRNVHCLTAQQTPSSPTSASQLLSRPSHCAQNSHTMPRKFVSAKPQYRMSASSHAVSGRRHASSRRPSRPSRPAMNWPCVFVRDVSHRQDCIVAINHAHRHAYCDRGVPAGRWPSASAEAISRRSTRVAEHCQGTQTDQPG
jgi:hypothetical protein